MNIKIWLFVVIILAVLIIGYVAGQRMGKNGVLASATSAGAAVNVAAGTSVTAPAATTKQGINQEASAKG